MSKILNPLWFCFNNQKMASEETYNVKGRLFNSFVPDRWMKSPLSTAKDQSQLQEQHILEINNAMISKWAKFREKLEITH